MRHAFEPPAQVFAFFSDRLQKAGLHHRFEYHPAARTDNRIAAEGGAVHAGGQYIFQFFAAQASADRQPAAQSLGKRDHIRLHAGVLNRQEFTGTACAGLHFIDHQQYVVFRTQCGSRLQIGGVERDYAAFALHAFQQNSADGGIHGIFECADVASLHVAEAFGEGIKIPMKSLLAGRGQGGHRTAVEGVDQRDDRCTAFAVMIEAVLAGELNCAFVRLGPRIAQKCPAHPRRPAQFTGKLCLHRIVIQVGGVLQRGGLICHRFRPGGVGIAEGIYSDAAAEIDVFLSLRVDRCGSFTVVERDREPTVGWHHRAAVERLYLLKIHADSSFP